MSQKENPIHEIRELLSPIKERPNVEPRPEFVYDLQAKIVSRKSKKQYNFPKPLLAFGTAALLLFVISLSFVSTFEPESAGKPSVEPFPIVEYSEVNLVTKVEYGDGENQVGFNPKGFEREKVSSFDIEDENFFILDDKNKRIFITDAQGNSRIIPVEKAICLEDILINEDIYVLDSVEKLVYQYSLNGELIKTYDISEVIDIPTGLGFAPGVGVTVNQNHDKVVSVETGKELEVKEQLYKQGQLSDIEGVIQLYENNEIKEISVPFEHSYGGIVIHGVNNNQVVFRKTEVAPDTKEKMAESHVYVINKKGETLGAVRIPIENMEFLPRHLVRTDENRIYLLSPEKDYLAIYEMKAGKSFETLLDDRIKEEQNLESESLGFDYKTHGEPYPELEQDISQLFTSDTIFASYSNKSLLNGVSINEDGTVIVDFKDFHEPGPSTAEKKEIHDTLAEIVFKYPEVKKVYFQFDGSFSDWCLWLETVEEPMTRVSYDLDMKTREILQLIKNGELDRLEDEYGANFTIAEDNKIIFEEMDIPELAIRPDMLQTMDSMEATTGFEEGNTFNFFYFLYSSEVDTATQIFVQYKKDENGNWVLANIRTNH